MGTAENNKRSVIVGVFVVLAIVILVSGIFILGGKQKRFEKTIEVAAVFDNIVGLKTGNNVWFSGVKVGTIKSLKFQGTSQVQVTMKIEEDVQKYIHKDAKARLSSESLIGNKIIEIYGGNPQVPMVQDGDILGTELAASTDEMMKTLQESNNNLLSITTDVKKLSAGLSKGEGTVGALLSDSLMADRFRAIVANLQQVSSTSVQASNALAQFTAKLNNEEGLANQLLTDTVVFNRLKGSVAELQKTASSASAISDNLEKASNKLNRDNNALGLMLNDEQFAGQVKNTLQNVETSTQKLDQSLDALRYSFFLKGAFRKKDKADAKKASVQPESANTDK